MRYTGPKNRIARRQGIDLGLKTPGSKSHARLLKKIAVPPGQHGLNKRRKVSERGNQIRETQKLRFMFGVTAKQLKNYFKKAVSTKGNTALYLCTLLESRLDNTVFRLGFTPTRAAARQLTTHGHITINGAVLDIASYQVKVGDIVSFKTSKTEKIPAVVKMLEMKDLIIPHWLERQATVGKLLEKPNMDALKDQIDLRLVIEYFSR